MTARVLFLVTLGLLAAAAGMRRPEAPPPRPAAVVLADPLPITRVPLAPGEFPPPGLRKLPLAEFEDLVQAAARSTLPPPKLVAARYRGTLTDDGLRGTGEWTTAGTHAGPTPLDPLRVAVANPKAAGGAVIYRTLAGVAVLAAGPGTTTFDWSARGADEPGAVRFDLRLPPAPLSLLELDLPPGRVPVAAQPDVLVTGPTPGAAGRQLWRIAGGGTGRVEFLVRGGGPGGPPLARGPRAARYEFAPGRADAAFEFDLESVRGPVSEWAFDVDPGLRILDAATPNLAGWRADAGKLIVSLRDPATAGRVGVTAVAEFPAGSAPWACPAVRPAAAVLGEETVDLRFGPDVKLLGWDAPDYHAVQAGVAPDRGYSVALRGTLAGTAGPARRRPAVRATAAGPEYASADDISWELSPGGSRLVGRFRLAVIRGPVFKVPVKLPPGFAAVGVRVTPDDPAAAWTAGPTDTMTLEPGRPFATGQTVELVVTLRGPAPPPPGDPAFGPAPPVTLGVPKFGPAAAFPRDGVFAVTVDAAYHARAAGAAAEPAPGAFAFAYAGRDADGSVTLVPRRPRAEVGGSVTIETDPAGRVVATTTLRPRSAAATAYTLFTPDSGNWEWAVTATGAAVKPWPAGELLPWLPLLAGGPPLPAFAGKFWQITPPRAGADGIEVVAVAMARGPNPASAPVAALLGAAAEELPVSGVAAAAVPARAGWTHAIDLRPRDQPAPGPGRGWAFAGLALATRIDADGVATAAFTGTITNAGGAALPVELPAGAVLETATVAGKWAAVAAGPKLSLPVPPPGPGGVRFELVYRLPGRLAGGFPVGGSPVPGLPGHSEPVERTWATEPTFRAWPGLTREAAGESVQFVSAGLVRGAGWAGAAVAAGVGAAWLARPRRRKTIAVGVGVAAVLGAAGFVLPDGWRNVTAPPLVVLLVGIVAGAARRRATAVVVTVLAAGGAAAGPDSLVVFVAGPDAFAPPAGVEKLAAIAGPPAVVTGVTYTGRPAGPDARFSAAFAVTCSRLGTHTLTVPLAGVRLEKATLDGRPAFPDAAKPDEFAVAVAGVGRHVLELEFVAPAVAVGGDREARFAAPDVATAVVTFAAAGAMPVVPTRRGTQVSTADAVTADHGGGRAVAVRWRPAGPATAATAATAAEANVWDLDEDEATLTAAAAIDVAGGTLGALTWDVPAGLEPGRLTVRAADGPNGVRDWSLGPAGPDGRRKLAVTFQNPVEGKAVVVGRFFPTAAAGQRPKLAFPRVVGVPVTDTFVGVRLAGAAVEAWEKENLVDYPADLILRAFAGVPELGLDKKPLTRGFRRDGPAAPGLRLTVKVPADPPPGSHDIVWKIGPTGSAVGTVKFAKPAAVLAFDAPAGVEVTDVRGPEVAGWSRAGAAVRVWFRTPPKEPVLTWTGPLSGYPPPSGFPDPVVFDLVPPAGASVRTETAPDWLVARTPGSDRVRIFPPLTDRVTRIAERVEAAGEGVLYRADVEIVPRANRPLAVTLRVAGLPAGATPTLDLPPGVTAVDRPTAAGRRAWQLAFPPGPAAAVRVGVTVKLPGGDDVPLPSATVTAGGVISPRTTRAFAAGPGVTVADADPVRATVIPPPQHAPAEPPQAVPPPAATPTADTGIAAAAGWVVALGVAGGLLVIGPRRFWPEVVAAFGLVAAAAGGPAFLAVAGIGVFARLVRAGRRVARAVLR